MAQLNAKITELTAEQSAAQSALITGESKLEARVGLLEKERGAQRAAPKRASLGNKELWPTLSSSAHWWLLSLTSINECRASVQGRATTSAAPMSTTERQVAHSVHAMTVGAGVGLESPYGPLPNSARLQPARHCSTQFYEGSARSSYPCTAPSCRFRSTRTHNRLCIASSAQCRVTAIHRAVAGCQPSATTGHRCAAHRGIDVRVAGALITHRRLCDLVQCCLPI